MDFTIQSSNSVSLTEGDVEFVQLNAKNSNDKELDEKALVKKLNKCLILYEAEPYQVFEEENELIIRCIKKESLLLDYIYK